jgi:myosin heavy subunit
MIEPIMYVGIGFLLAGLLVIGLIPSVHARAVRLTQRRLEAMTPMSMAEIQADKDQLRAEFAMSTRRLEMSVDQMKAKTTSQLAEIGKKSEAVGRLKIELGEKAAALMAAEARVNSLEEELKATQNELAAKAEALTERERTLAGTTAELAKFTTQYHETSLSADSQRVELASLLAKAEVYKGTIASHEQEGADLKERLGTQTALAETANRELAEERAKNEQHTVRIAEAEHEHAVRMADVEHQLVLQTTEAEILSRRVQELLARLDEHERTAGDRDLAVEEARHQAAAAQRIEADVRAELARHQTQHTATIESMTAERTLADEQLRQALAERDRIAGEMAIIKRDAEAAWEAERMESAVMRERINDVAAEVARLTATLEGPGSPIEAILANDGGRPRAAGNGSAVKAAGGESEAASAPKGSLADRIRALQSKRAQMPKAS